MRPNTMGTTSENKRCRYRGVIFFNLAPALSNFIVGFSMKLTIVAIGSIEVCTGSVARRAFIQKADSQF